ncbi:MAG: RNA polymerase sigma factor [Phycisphaerae bacterium]|nr:RNA polymerase sigma factor [Saprospiraceae bacterium]
MHPCTDEEVLAWLRNGSPESENKAIDCLYRRLLGIFRPWVFSRKGSSDDAHDAVTEAVIAFVQNFRDEKYREMGKLEHLLFRIAQRRFYDLLRERGKELPTDPTLPFDLPPAFVEEDPFDKAELEASQLAKHSKLAQCLDKIGERCKERLVRFWYLKQSHEEIAAAMGNATAKGAKVMKNKCQDKLEACMKG